MKIKNKWQSVRKVADLIVDEDSIIAVVSDESGRIVSSVVIALVDDADEKEALYWELRKALGDYVEGVI